MDAGARGQVVLVRAGGRVCAIPVRDVVETMRSTAVTPLSGVPAFVAGAAVVRGEPVPVVDLDRLLGGAGGASRRFVLVRCGGRRAAIAVDEVLGVRPLDAAEAAAPLLAGAGEGAVAALGARDGALLSVLEAARAVPAEAFDAAGRVGA